MGITRDPVMLEKIKFIEGFISPGEAECLTTLLERTILAIRTVNARSRYYVVEIGSFDGYSTAAMGWALRWAVRTDNVHVFAIDTWDAPDFYPDHRHFFHRFWDNIVQVGVQGAVVPIIGRSEEVAKWWDRPIDFLFIDGGHDYEQAMADFYGFYPWVEVGGLIVFHDVTGEFPGVLQAWNSVKKVLGDHGEHETMKWGTKT